jgi:hypothetical protein
MKSVVIIVTFLVLIASTLSAEEKAAGLVDQMIEAHGGLANWKTAKTVYFEDQWTYPGGQKGPVARITVDQRSRRAYHDYPDLDATIVWDGEKAWSTNWSMPVPPRFMATLNYYFVNLPWLTKDPGVNLGAPGVGKLWLDETEYKTIRVTYDSGVGDTPDDYYVLYIDPATKLLKACEYIVTYKSILPDGVDQSPPHVLVFESFETVNGLKVPTQFTIYENEEFYAGCEIGKWSFSKPFDEARMTMPDGAVIDNTQP